MLKKQLDPDQHETGLCNSRTDFGTTEGRSSGRKSIQWVKSIAEEKERTVDLLANGCPLTLALVIQSVSRPSSSSKDVPRSFEVIVNLIEDLLMILGQKRRIMKDMPPLTGND
jgi:hypothetical protein